MTDKERALRERIAEYRTTVSRLAQNEALDGNARETAALATLKRTRRGLLADARDQLLGWLDREWETPRHSDHEFVRVLRLYEDTDDALAERPARKRDTP